MNPKHCHTCGQDLLLQRVNRVLVLERDRALQEVELRKTEIEILRTELLDLRIEVLEKRSTSGRKEE